MRQRSLAKTNGGVSSIINNKATEKLARKSMIKWCHRSLVLWYERKLIFSTSLGFQSLPVQRTLSHKISYLGMFRFNGRFEYKQFFINIIHILGCSTITFLFHILEYK